MRTAAVLAGGLGTRIASLTGDTLPKALVPIAGEPFLHHKLSELRRLGAGRVVLVLGHRAEPIIEYVGDGHPWGLDVVVVEDGPTLLGTGGALKRAAPLLPDRFWVTYGDTLLDVDLAAAERRAEEAGWEAVLTVLHNRDRWQPSNVRLDGDLVVSYTKAPPPGTHEHIDYGYLYLTNRAVTAPAEDAFDLGVVMEELVAARSLGSFEAQVPFHTIGTPDELRETETWIRSLGDAG
jgi:MurNAc alpha-1-phosphate uridylyltransferase